MGPRLPNPRFDKELIRAEAAFVIHSATTRHPKTQVVIRKPHGFAVGNLSQDRVSAQAASCVLRVKEGVDAGQTAYASVGNAYCDDAAVKSIRKFQRLGGRTVEELSERSPIARHCTIVLVGKIPREQFVFLSSGNWRCDVNGDVQIALQGTLHGARMVEIIHADAHRCAGVTPSTARSVHHVSTAPKTRIH